MAFRLHSHCQCQFLSFFSSSSSESCTNGATKKRASNRSNVSIRFSRLAKLRFDDDILVIYKRGDVQHRQGVVRRILPKECSMDSGWEVGRDAAEGKGILSLRERKASGKVRATEDDGFTRSKLAVFVSGGGSNFRALHASTLKNSIYGDIAVVVSDKPGCGGCEYARENGIPVLTFPVSKNAQDGLTTPDLLEALRNHGIDFILLAGYLKLIPSEIVQAYPRAVLNIHPALLPSFGGKGKYGMKLHEAVIKSGARYSGPTVHFVDENFDTGPILAQRTVPVLGDDSPHDLAARILKVEHVLYSEAVAALCEDRIFWRDDGVPLIRKSWDEAEYS